MLATFDPILFYSNVSQAGRVRRTRRDLDSLTTRENPKPLSSRLLSTHGCGPFGLYFKILKPLGIFSDIYRNTV